MGVKQRQQHYYDKHSKPLDPISIGDTVRMKLPGRSRWDVGTCTGQVGPRNYEVKVGHGTYRRNRRQLVSTGEQHLGLQQEDPVADDRPLESTTEPTAVPVPPGEPPSASSDPIVLRRSARKGKAPEWHKDYHIP